VKDEPLIGNFLQPLSKGMNDYDIDDLHSSQSSMQFVPRDAKRIARQMEKRGESTEGYYSSEVGNHLEESSRMPVPPVDWNAMLSSDAFSDPEI